MAAAAHASFLDSTLSGALEDARLPPRLADEQPVFATDRVIPLLVRDIVQSMQVRQRLHLKQFQEHLDDFLTFDDTATLEDMEMLLVMLFSFAHRRTGLTPLQKKHNTEASDLAFPILHRLISSPHSKRELVLDALRRVCEMLGCATAPSAAATSPQALAADALASDAASPSPPPPSVLPLPEEYATVVDHLGGEIAAVAVQIHAAAEEVACRNQSAVGESAATAAAQPSSAELFPHAPPFAYSIDALPMKDRRGLTEATFGDVVAWYNALPALPDATANAAPGASSASEDLRDATKLFAQGGVLGGVMVVTAEQAQRLKHTADGGVALLDVLRFLFPLVPQQSLLQRIHGRVLLPQVNCSTTGTTAAAPIPSFPQRVEDVPTTEEEHHAIELSRWIAQGQPAAQAAAAIRHMCEWFFATDVLHQGYIFAETFSAAGSALLSPAFAADGDASSGIAPRVGGTSERSSSPSSTMLLTTLASPYHHASQEHDGGAGGLPWIRNVQQMFRRMRRARLSIYDVAVQIFPGDRFAKVKDQFTATLRAVDREYTAAAKYCAERNTAYKLALLKFVEMHVGENPSGDPDTAVSMAGNLAIAEVAHEQRREHYARTLALLKLDALEHQKARLAAEQSRAQLVQREEIERARCAQVEPVAGPPIPPVSCGIGGFQVNRYILELDMFADASTRCMLTEILRALDLGGVNPEWFLQDAASLHWFLPGRLLTNTHGRVLRDFAFCSPRPPIGGMWKEDHNLRIVTNVSHSLSMCRDVKYRIVVEGYNFGINRAIYTIVVGFATKSMESVGAFESFGWPDGWDQCSVTHLSGGFERVVQHFREDDGMLVLDCSAHSLSKVGFSVSAWLCIDGFGTDFPLSAYVEHM